MTAKGETPKTDLSAGIVSANKESAPKKKKIEPKINLLAGLVAKGKNATAPADQPEGEKAPSTSASADSSPAAKRKKIAPKVNLSAGLVPKGKSAESAVDRSADIHSPSTSSSTDFSPAARSTERGRPSAAAVSARSKQISREDGVKRVEPPPTRKPVRVSDEAMPAVTSELPAAPPASPPLRPRVPSMLRTGKFTGQEPPQSAREREPQPTTPPPAPDALRHYPETPPVQSWERVSNRLDDFHPETAPEAVREPESEEIPYNAATRLSGLRNLIFSLGLQNLHKEAKPADEDAESAPQPGRGTERQVNARSFTPASAPAGSSRSSASGASPTLVTATPEILPPEPAADKTDKERSWASKGKARRDRRDAFDDVEILPSWRGQYKKK